jgi:hypothetical protein
MSQTTPVSGVLPFDETIGIEPPLPPSEVPVAARVSFGLEPVSTDQDFRTSSQESD